VAKYATLFRETVISSNTVTWLPREYLVFDYTLVTIRPLQFDIWILFGYRSYFYLTHKF